LSFYFFCIVKYRFLKYAYLKKNFYFSKSIQNCKKVNNYKIIKKDSYFELLKTLDTQAKVFVSLHSSDNKLKNLNKFFKNSNSNNNSNNNIISNILHNNNSNNNSNNDNINSNNNKDVEKNDKNEEEDSNMENMIFEALAIVFHIEDTYQRIGFYFFYYYFFFLFSTFLCFFS
jgi:hypothetical protein